MAEDDAPAGIPQDFQLIGEHYRLTAKLGEGAFGEVYEAHHDLLDQAFAVKILRPELCEDQDTRERFLDEARALIRFSHSNVVQLRHVGQHKNRLYLVMDLVRGRPLDEILDAEGAFSEERAIGIMQQVLAGLEAAHAAGIIHRDLKPSNLILEEREDGTDAVRILDFGLSKLHAVDGMKSSNRSMTGTIIGTLAYMSPEQLTGSKDIDQRSDVFAAGLLLHEMLQGQHPYPGESGIVVAAKLLRDQMPNLTNSADISASTRAALATAVERDPDARYSSVTMFSEALAGKGPPSDTSRITTVQDAQRELARREAAAAKKQAEATPVAATATSSRSWMPLLLLLVIGGGVAGAWAAGLFGGKQDASTETAKQPQGPAPVVKEPEPIVKDPDPVVKEPEPVVKDPEPVVKEPEPVVKDPEPVVKEPEPVVKDPEPVVKEPEPVVKDPEPVVKEPEPVVKDPEPVVKEPEPVVKDPEPVVKEPEPVVKDPVPVVKEPEAERVPPDPTATLSPQACCAQARAAMKRQAWDRARALFARALADPQATKEEHVRALRGVAESWFGQVGTQARSGKLAEAIASLGQARAFLEERIRAYGHEAQDATAFQTESGFARMHLGEAHTEYARWLNIAGKSGEARKHLQPAADSFEFAHPMLDRDGANYAEFLMRRGALHRLQGRLEAYFEDLARTTKTNNTEVPTHAWVAHATGARHIAEAWWAKNDMAKARDWANQAVDVAKRGVSWCEDDLTQEQWLVMIRTLFVAGTLTGSDGDPLPLFGLAKFWTTLAKKAKPDATIDERIARARLLEADAVVGYLDGRSLAKRGKQDRATKQLTAALIQADEALALRQAVASAGGPLPIKYTQQIRAGLLFSAGRTAEAQAAAQAAAEADARNPD